MQALAVRFHDITLALLRVVTGFLVWQHGAQRVLGLFGGSQGPAAAMPWAVGLFELIGGVALAAGVLTRPVALLLAADMAVLYVTQFLPEAFPPIVDRRGEVVVLLTSISFLLAFTGAGRWAVDGMYTTRSAGEGGLSSLGRYERTALGLVRVVIGLLFFEYGLQKLFGMIGETAEPLFTLQWFAGVIEFFGGAALAAGLFTRPVAFVCCGQMAVAYFLNHHPRGFFPIQNGGERAVLFCYFFLFLVAAGPGAFSLDGRLSRRRSPR